MKFGLFSKKIARLSYTLGMMSLLVGIVLSITHLPTNAAGTVEVTSPRLITNDEIVTCTPPDDWERTVRLHHMSKASTEWKFEIDEPVMGIILEFFYYQDYDKEGCPFDCSTGACQVDEIGVGESPLGSVRVEDGKEGATGSVIRQKGSLEEGTYQVTFKVTGKGSLNIGLRVHKQSVPTVTPEPTLTGTPTPTEIVLVPTSTVTEIPPTATATDMPPTATPTEAVLTPTVTEIPPTATATDMPPTATPSEAILTPTVTEIGAPPTATPTDVIQPPAPTKTSRPPATLSPPTPPPGVTQTPGLIPVAGTDFTTGRSQPGPYHHLFINMGIGLLGLGLIFHGISNNLSKV